MRPALLTFDIFGTVIDWRRGLRESLRRHGTELNDPEFDQVIDFQADLENGRYRSYASIVASSLVHVLGIPSEAARSIAVDAGSWPLYPDVRAGLGRLMRIAPCVASTNSDESHGRQMQRSLGFDLTEWICSEEIRSYKPNPAIWAHVASRLGARFGRDWYHVSAYADYDLETARRLGLTCVFVSRPHARPGRADLHVRDLHDLAHRLERA
ncbi:MAG: hypothetical protein E6K76_04940 [Candidatus Eisenbacteria bacterium]|uniref:Haloacid dehalogenase type II n=1 Tax=Eiseniibacteriota bacterium TaxID=2212470 RepID=A0A538T714_UNCEI|nr:MAG: hypothetical protein E6K76_04940 [Candidatus Eisenbacteria bacterium]